MTRASLLAAVLALVLVGASWLPGTWPTAPDVTAEAFLLLDARSGQSLAEGAADRPRPVASTVKLLTALTVLRHAAETEIVEVGPEVTGLEGASVGLTPGARWSVTDLLEGLLVRSGNDAAMALAFHVGGSLEGFLRLMREEAADLGLEDVTLVSPSGLDDANRLSARDLAIITRAALEEPVIAGLVAAQTVEIPTDPAAETRNELLGTYPGATGVKTGYTEAAGWSVIASARRDGRTLIAVVLASSGPEQRFTDAAALLDHGFDNFVELTPTTHATLRVAAGDVTIQATGPRLLVPSADPDVAVEFQVPVEVGEVPSEVPVTWQGDDLGIAIVRVGEVDRAPVEGAGSIARYLADRGYAAMRAATATGSWSR